MYAETNKMGWREQVYDDQKGYNLD